MVTWFYKIQLFIISVIKRFNTRQADFVLAYPQAPIQHNLYTKLTKGNESNKGNDKTYVLKLIRNLYSQKN